MFGYSFVGRSWQYITNFLCLVISPRMNDVSVIPGIDNIDKIFQFFLVILKIQYSPFTKLSPYCWLCQLHLLTHFRVDLNYCHIELINYSHPITVRMPILFFVQVESNQQEEIDLHLKKEVKVIRGNFCNGIIPCLDDSCHHKTKLYKKISLTHLDLNEDK